jgi:NtrC-family two-component system response regulator AlgB
MTDKRKILLVDDEPNILKTMSLSIESMGYEVLSYSSPSVALVALDTDPELLKAVDIAFIDLMMHPVSGIDMLRELHLRKTSMLVVIITAHGSVESVVEAMKLGAYDYIQKPFNYNELAIFLQRISRSSEAKKSYEGGGGIITNDAYFQSILKTAEKIAKTNITVLIEGETGVGKELVADFIQKNSDRKDKPYIKLNCAALSEGLIESELFGHVKGAFTGAVKDRIGMIEGAEGGTLFLDEIGEMPMLMQAKLLRLLQNHEYYRLGENHTRKSDVRIIAATNRNLEEEIGQRGFREDLYYRLSGFRLTVPPLRQRRGDILPITDKILSHYASGAGQMSIPSEVETMLLGYDWRGNVRELENVMIRAAVLSDDQKTIKASDLPEYIRFQSKGDIGVVVSPELRSIEEVEHDHIRFVLSRTKSLEEAAKILGIDSATLWRKRKKYGM